MKKLTTLLFSLGIIGIASSTSAANLLQVFQQAQATDPTYKEAESTYLSAKSQLSQARSVLLPNLDLTGSWMHTRTNNKIDRNYPVNPANGSDDRLTVNGTDATLTLTQPLFNWYAFKGYQKVKIDVKAAAATYAVAAESLITRTANAYFTVLKDEDLLRFAEANKRQYYRSYLVSRQRYHVGLDAIAAVYDAKASYDGAKASYIAAENTLANDKEALREITGQLYPSLARLKENFPLLKPNPASIDAWTQAAEQQNLSLQAARYTASAAKEYIKVQSAQHLPSLNLSGSYDDANNKRVGGGRSRVKTGAIGVNLTVPIFAGGLYSAQTKTAMYDYQTAAASMDYTHRQIIASVRSAYLGVLAEISQIQADRQAIKSAKASLASYEAGYKVGTQTIVDVLQAQSKLYENEQTYASDRFNYVMNTFNLRKAAGILSVDDVVKINNWLTTTSITNVTMIKPRKKQRTVSKATYIHRVKIKTTAKQHNKKITGKSSKKH